MALNKFAAAIALTACLAPTLARAGWFNRVDRLNRRGKPEIPHDGCEFELSSTGALACPAGQLGDGQIRLNGSYPTSKFMINEEGGITDQNGFGCIVTPEPVTQIQCDQGKAPMTGFSIGADNTLSYHGSADFYACPATDTEYNIYVKPNFGQDKCFPIGLKASGCGGGTTCPAPSVSTVWQTETVTSTHVDTITSTITWSVGQCSSSWVPPTWGNSTSYTCRRCTKTTDTTSAPTDSTVSTTSTWSTETTTSGGDFTTA